MSRRRLVRLLLVVVAFVPLALLSGSDVRAQVVLRQVYGGNGNVYRQDYVELFNRGGTPVSLAGWSIQYASATGTGLFSGGAPSALSGSLAPGQSLLVGFAASAAGMPLPEPFLAGNPATNLSSQSGKLALVRSTVGLPCNGGSSPCGPALLDQIVDLVGYGSASFFEGQAAAPAASVATSLFRGGGGCLDTFSNALDFVAGPPLPRTAASPLEPCPAGPAVELAVSASFASELDRSAIVVRATTDAPVSGPQSVGLAVGGLGLTAEDYTLSDVWLSIADGATSATASLSVLDDTLSEGTERLSLTLASPTAGLRLGGSIHASVVLADDDECGEPAVAIHAVQGSGADSPTVGLATEVEAIVTGRFLGTADDSLQGFFLQEEDVDADGDATTSEGLFVSEASSGLAAGVAVGDRVRVCGTVRERSGATALEALVDVGLCTHGEAMPTAARPVLPIPGVPSDDLAAARAVIDTYAERFESMRVEFPMSLAVGEAFDLARLGQLSLHEGPRIRTFTDANLPSVPGQLAHRIDVARRRVLLDDGDERLDGALENGRPLPYPQPGLSLSNRFRAGDRILGLAGVLDRSTRDRGIDEPFRIRPVAELAPFVFVAANPPPAAPPDVGGSLAIASFNVANYFATIDTSASGSAGSCGPAGVLDCRGADSAAEFEQQTEKLRAAICALAPDVLALMEIENDEGATAEGLARALDTVPDCGAWTALATGSIGSDAIRVALLFRPAAVVPVGAPRILDASVDPRFLDGRNRPVLAQTLREIGTGETFTLAIAHLKSKGSPCSGPGDVDLGDGQGHCNATRTAGARALVDWLASDPTASGDPDFLIVGDLNSYRREDPVRALAEGPDDVPGTADDYVDLVLAFAGPAAYSYVFDGQLGRLDHAFASASLAARITGAAEWHVNADEPPAFDYDDAVVDPGEARFEAKPDALPLFAADARRTSDHDPLLIGLPETDMAVLVAAGGLAAFALARRRARRGLWRCGPPLYIPAVPQDEQGVSDACDREGDDVGVGPVGRGGRFGRGARQPVAGRDEHGDAGHEDAGPEPADLYPGERGGTRGPFGERRQVHDVERAPIAGQVQLGRDLPRRQRNRRDGLPGPRRVHLDDDHDDRRPDHEDGGPGQAGRELRCEPDEEGDRRAPGAGRIADESGHGTGVLVDGRRVDARQSAELPVCAEVQDAALREVPDEGRLRRGRRAAVDGSGRPRRRNVARGRALLRRRRRGDALEALRRGQSQRRPRLPRQELPGAGSRHRPARVRRPRLHLAARRTLPGLLRPLRPLAHAGRRRRHGRRARRGGGRGRRFRGGRDGIRDFGIRCPGPGGRGRGEEAEGAPRLLGARIPRLPRRSVLPGSVGFAREGSSARTGAPVCRPRAVRRGRVRRGGGRARAGVPPTALPLAGLALAVLALTAGLLAAPASQAAGELDPYPKAAAAYLVVVNGAVLWAHEPDRALPPASLTKMMTALLLAEDWKPEAIVQVGAEAAAATGSRLGLRKGDRLRFADAFDALLVGSANDACLALAAHAAGSVERFVERMNARAATLGLRATRFRNPCGLDAPGHLASARDLHRLAIEAMKAPELARAVALKSVDFRTVDGRRLRKASGNLLLGRVEGAIGVKSGFTNRAGKCLAAFVRRGRDEVAVILLNAPDRWWSASILIDDAFAALDAARR